jgi:solute carrier family 25 protein 42
MNSDTLITTISGSASGFAATFAKQPIQRIKWIRQVHEGPAIPYRNIFRDTYANIGLRGFFNGSMAAIYRNVPHSTLAYTIYPKAETLVFRLQKWLGQDEPDSASRKRNFTTRFGAGYITLFGATLITHPLDTLRVRLSVRENENPIARFV